MNKKERQNLILKLIEEYEISTQEELTKKLNETGKNISQATISRDIKELNLIKSDGKGVKSKYVKFSHQQVNLKSIEMFRSFTDSISYVNNLIVIKTLGGHGSAAASVIDSMHLPQILGTIAGDDTVLIIAHNEHDAQMIVKSLRVL